MVDMVPVGSALQREEKALWTVTGKPWYIYNTFVLVDSCLKKGYGGHEES